jgi:hypothetical protein
MVLFANIFMKIRLCNGEMLFLSPICQAVLLIFVGMLSKARIVLFAHALDTSAQRALCDNNAKTDD